MPTAPLEYMDCHRCRQSVLRQPVRTDAGVVGLALCGCDYAKCQYCDSRIGPKATACGSCGAPLPPWTLK